MCFVVKATKAPTWRFDRPGEAGAVASLPRNAAPLMLVIRTDRVSIDRVPARSVSLTKSPIFSPRISCRSSTSSIPARSRISSMFSISTGLRMIGPLSPRGKVGHGRRKAKQRPVADPPVLILSRDLRGGCDDVAVAVSHQEITVGDLGGSSVHADPDVHPVVILPQEADLHPVQVAWPTQNLYYLFAESR